jgi:hypothetical protein
LMKERQARLDRSKQQKAMQSEIMAKIEWVDVCQLWKIYSRPTYTKYISIRIASAQGFH